MAGKPGMRERWSSPTYAAACRAKIRAGMVLNHLQNHVAGRIEMTASQVTAAAILLRKVLPDQSETKSDITVRRIESLSEEQARMMAEEFVNRAQRDAAAGAEEPAGVHDSLPPGLQTSSGTPQDS